MHRAGGGGCGEKAREQRWRAREKAERGEPGRPREAEGGRSGARRPAAPAPFVPSLRPASRSRPASPRAPSPARASSPGLDGIFSPGPGPAPGPGEAGRAGPAAGRGRGGGARGGGRPAGSRAETRAVESREEGRRMAGPPRGRGEAVGRRRRGEDGERAAAGRARRGLGAVRGAPALRRGSPGAVSLRKAGLVGAGGGWGPDPGSQKQEAAAAWVSGFLEEEGAGDPYSRILRGGGWGLGGLDSGGPEEERDGAGKARCGGWRTLGQDARPSPLGRWRERGWLWRCLRQRKG